MPLQRFPEVRFFEDEAVHEDGSRHKQVMIGERLQYGDEATRVATDEDRVVHHAEFREFSDPEPAAVPGREVDALRQELDAERAAHQETKDALAEALLDPAADKE